MSAQPAGGVHPEFTALTSLRGIACVAIVYFHAYIDFRTLSVPSGWICPKTYLLLDFFQVLSGFVMAHAYGDRLPQRGTGVLRDFFVARFARIYPLHFATLMLMVLIELGRWALERHGYATLNSPAFSYATQLRYLPYDITLTHAWGFLPQQTWNVPSWSISAETFCYLAYPLVLRAGVGRGRTATITAWTCSLGALAGLQWWRGGLDLTYDFSPLRCLPEFVIGSLLYQHTRAHHHLLVNRQWKREALPVAACLLVLLSMWMQTTDIVVVTALAMMVITCADNRSRLARVLSLKPLHYLGDISYSVYLLHHLVLVLFIVVLMVNQGSVADFLLEHSTVTIMLACLTAVVLAHFSYQRLERPAQRWLRRWLGRRRAPEPAAAPASG